MESVNVSQSQPVLEFIRLGASARSAASVAELGFVMANETYRLIHYRQAFFTLITGDKLTLEIISGLSSVDRNSPFYDWFNQLGKYLVSQKIQDDPSIVEIDSTPSKLQEEWYEWLPTSLMLVPLSRKGRVPLAYLLLAREATFSGDELQTVKALAEVYGHALDALMAERPFYAGVVTHVLKKRTYLIAVAILIVLLFLPVQQSTLGTAEITPLTYSPVSTSVDGVIAKILVKPNEYVKQGQPLFKLDDTTTRNRLESAHRTMGVAKSEEFMNRQKSFVDSQSRAELATNEARVKEKGSAISYMQELLGKMVVKSPQSGVILYSDPADWEGKPVATGERIMTLADENSAGMTIWLPVADAVVLDPGKRVRLFLHTEPLNPREGVVLRSSFQPVASPDGIASYRVTASFADGVVRPRLGLKGTAKVYGESVTLGYYLFRRPIGAVRQWMGW